MSTVGLTANNELKRILMQFTKSTRGSESNRTLPNLIKILDEHYAVSAREVEMQALGKLMQFKKEPFESLPTFWFRYESLLHQLDSSHHGLGEEFLFMR